MSKLSSILGSPQDDGLFYIRNGGFCGNCFIWWRAGGNGYTCDLREAGKFTLRETKRIIEHGRKEDRAYSVKEVNAKAVIHFTNVAVKPIDVLKIEDRQETLNFDA